MKARIKYNSRNTIDGQAAGLIYCPFCGNTPNMVTMGVNGSGITFVECNNCGAVVSFRGNESREQTTKAWNTRKFDTIVNNGEMNINID